MRKILICDDEPEIVNIMSKYLSKCGYEVVPVSNGIDALEVLGSDKGIELLIIDMKMPGLKGPDVLREMRARGINIPFFVLTGIVDSDQYAAEIKELSGGMDVILNKPMDLNELRKKIVERFKD